MNASGCLPLSSKYERLNVVYARRKDDQWHFASSRGSIPVVSVWLPASLASHGGKKPLIYSPSLRE